MHAATGVGLLVLPDAVLQPLEYFRAGHCALEHQHLHPEAMGVLARGCASNLAVVACNFGYCGLGPECARLLAEALKTNCSIAKVQLQHNHLGPKGAGSVAQAMKVGWVGGGVGVGGWG